MMMVCCLSSQVHVATGTAGPVPSSSFQQPSATGRHLLSTTEAEQAQQIEAAMAASAVDPPLEEVTPAQENRTSLLALILMSILEVVESYPILP